MAYYHSKYGTGRRKKNKARRVIFLFLFVLILLSLGAGYWLYNVIFMPNTWTASGKPASVFVPTGANYDTLKVRLYKNGLIVHRKNFEWWAEKKKLPELVKPGHYLVKNGMSNYELVEMLRSGRQTPVKVIFNNVRNIYQLAGRVSKQIEADSLSIIQLLTDSLYVAKMGVTPETVATVFIPNTYEFYWNTTAEGFVGRMYQEYVKFWNDERKKKAESLGLTPVEVVILASIVEKETNKNEEKPKIASVYLNRLKKGWRLQADPTVVYAIGDYSIHRVLNIHKKFDSPYNTYQHGGLPPGPICIPSLSSIKAVLNPDENNYLFFCAKDDMSGYHVFAKTNRQHQKNARKYQRALDKMRVFK